MFPAERPAKPTACRLKMKLMAAVPILLSTVLRIKHHAAGAEIDETIRDVEAQGVSD